ncbi:UDP-glucosyltransferase 2-like isoform X2 [Leptopilina boulardi]|uniref:UDP-glucosyltransferase 2-like isoform X2 n=1 Tax=Leptopilina boulardi TaxID=63433 RepID=UPI0021F51E61|nr:UDP-glucosyltransferase 2-like isoform X2 [Leptopilina boulardi]
MVLPKTFFQRLKSTFVFYQSRYIFEKITHVQTEAMRKYLSSDIPNIREIEKTVSLMFVNSHHTLFAIRPNTPAVIPIAGIHIEENDDELSLELKKWMDDSIHGVIYFNLGAMMLIESFPRDTLLAFYASFAKVAPIRILMKIASEDKLPPGLPQNILTLSWIPQIPVLKHNNTKVFITHGGLMSLQEAIYHAVPMIGLPFFIDQLSNIEICVEKNIGIRLDLKTLTETKLNNALNLILNDSKYSCFT